ncbi:MAG TPA: sulfurtransferase [Gemmatimonadales bacterium]|nr:sulfurtransferase [Gemmatimonadales bacterium]
MSPRTIFICLLAGVHLSCAQGGRSPSLPRLVSTDQLAGWLQDRRVNLVDVRTDVFTYLKGHLPGAVYLNPETLRASEGGIPTQLLSSRSYSELFSRLGLSFELPVVIYSAGETRNIDATFLAWLLAGFGHPNVYLLNGGYFKWQLEQHPIALRYPRIEPVSFPRSFAPERATLGDVRQAMQDRNTVVVDARPPDQFAGEAGAQMRRGHIPGAVNHYWQDDLMQEGFGHVWKPVQDLRAVYLQQGISPDRRVIVYCNSATEASHVYFTLRYLLNYPSVRVYVGSWTEWSERDELPIEAGQGGRRAAGQ